MFRIRENFSTDIHSNTSISDFDLKWNERIMGITNESPIILNCEKVSNQVNCIEIKNNSDHLVINTSYLIGLDYLQKDFPFMVEPKFSYHETDYDLDFYSILFSSLPFVKSKEDISDLYFVDFSKPPIEINQKDDYLTPVLVIQFIVLLNKICHSGLQKGYYWIENNLDGKVKGKILVKDTMKFNHLKSNFSRTVCKYQEYGVDTAENRFLKYTFQFCLNYLGQFKKLKITQDIESMVGFITSTFEKVSRISNVQKEIYVRNNPLFPIYGNALKLANLILKRNSFNITNTTSTKVKTFPYWINMSKLFEIHILKLLRMRFKEGVYYQRKYSGLFPDIILDTENNKAVIDVKYKPYGEKDVAIEDIRQVAAYSRMKEIFTDLKIEKETVLDSIIVYPEIGSKNDSFNIENKMELPAYYNIFKLDVNIPVIQS